MLFTIQNGVHLSDTENNEIMEIQFYLFLKVALPNPRLSGKHWHTTLPPLAITNKVYIISAWKIVFSTFKPKENSLRRLWRKRIG